MTDDRYKFYNILSELNAEESRLYTIRANIQAALSDVQRIVSRIESTKYRLDSLGSNHTDDEESEIQSGISRLYSVQSYLQSAYSSISSIDLPDYID